MAEAKGSFSGTIGFVLAAAGSAIGLGNIWRFPYLAAQNGGGLFLIVYLVLLLVFGLALLLTEIAIGRKTRQSPLYAYRALHPKGSMLGLLATIVPFLILPYYCVIGGWVTKYFVLFLTGHAAEAAQAKFFTSFISSVSEPIVYTVFFLLATAYIIYRGVAYGIERISIILMPILFLMIIGIAIFALTLSHTDGEVTRTGFDGLAYYLAPKTEGMTFNSFLSLCLAALGQLFYSISFAMGIMIAYGSYFEDKGNLFRSVTQIAFFDTLVAFLAGIMIIVPFVVFQGEDAMQSSGPSLLFISVPKLFVSMGSTGVVVGTIFFLMVFFASLTSAISILEAVVACFMERFDLTRKKATFIETAIALGLAVIVCLGYNVFYFEYPLPNGSIGQILDFMDFASCNFLMPILAIGTCIFIGWVVSPRVLLEEATKNGEKFLFKGLYSFVIRYAAPVILTIILLQCFGVFK